MFNLLLFLFASHASALPYYCDVFANDQPRLVTIGHASDVQLLILEEGRVHHEFLRPTLKAFRSLELDDGLREIIFDFHLKSSRELYLRKPFAFQFNLSRPIRVRYNPAAEPHHALFERTQSGLYQGKWGTNKPRFEVLKLQVLVGANGATTGKLPVLSESLFMDWVISAGEEVTAHLTRRWATIEVSPEGLVDWESLSYDPPANASQYDLRAEITTTRRPAR